MPIGSQARRAARKGRIAAQFPAEQVDAVLDLLHLTDMAWHDCYGPKELEIPIDVLEDVLLLAEGSLAALIRCARAASHLSAAAPRSRPPPPPDVGLSLM